MNKPVVHYGAYLAANMKYMHEILLVTSNATLDPLRLLSKRLWREWSMYLVEMLTPREV